MKRIKRETIQILKPPATLHKIVTITVDPKSMLLTSITLKNEIIKIMKRKKNKTTIMTKEMTDHSRKCSLPMIEEIDIINTRMIRRRMVRIKTLPRIDLTREKTAPKNETKTITEIVAAITKTSSGREVESMKEKTGKSEMLNLEEECKTYVRIIKRRTSPQKTMDLRNK